MCMHLLIIPWFILTDINECELEIHTCHSNANCTDTDGSFNCTCREGFEGNGFNCTGIQLLKQCLLVGDFLMSIVADIPECERELDDCDQNATCINTFGSYDCLCNTGFTGDGFTCAGQQKKCSKLCTPLEPVMIVYRCITTCYYVWLFVFIDINECEIEIDNCHEKATCNNTFGSFECTCIAGFEGDGVNCTSKTVGKGQVHIEPCIM